VRVILLGAPGAGKGTQAGFLSRELQLAHIASGDLFREALEKGTELGLLAKSYMEKGQLVPDEVATKLVLERIVADDCKKGFILDGFPRSLEQAESLDDMLKNQGIAIDSVFYTKVSVQELISRLGGRWTCRNCQAPYHEVNFPPKTRGICDKCGGELYQRADDTPETVQKRLDVYFSQTVPLIEYYQSDNRLTEINGEQDISLVETELMGKLRRTMG